MDNAMVIAGHGRAVSRRLLVRLSVMALSLSAAFAVVMVLFQRQAEAQFTNPFTQIVCPILISLANAFAGAFGGLLAGLFNSLLAAFGCSISG